MGWLLVRFPTVRQVCIDDAQCGVTNTPLEVPNGHHRVDLGPVLDYSPAARNVVVQGEPYSAPVTTTFTQS
ncbi:MAG TPA: hypothetical protein VNO75_12690 [Gemmatimonadaceae bacterium]|nr:hypothetical protein [Gemmatimonadaceae bacterium]